MVLSELRDYLKQKKTVSLNELIIHFDMDADALRGMLGKWISKGKVRQLPVNSACGSSCCKCDPTLIELYEWWGEELAQD
ncbi:MAG: FeoC-like transcriptional regulator [Methylococcales bacterium]|nr:FeoC-like transcriptional regulator [Methylococcales bacterium]